MSDLRFCDNMEEPFEDTDDPFGLLKNGFDIDIPPNLNMDNPSMMSSEFFDSVYSLEEPIHFTDNLEFSSLSNIDSEFGANSSEFGANSSDLDELRLVNSCSPDSGSSSTGYELNDCVVVNEEVPKPHFLSDTSSEAKLNLPVLNRSAKFYVGNPNTKKVIVTKPFSTKPRKANAQSTKQQIFRVQSISGNGRPLLLPFNVANLKNIKNIRIVNGKVENIKVTKVVADKPYIDKYVISSPETHDDDDSDSLDAKSDKDGQNLEVNLTDEEKRLLAKEGILMPSHYPLSKQQERELKRIRRKIRNKISAQDSRKRKKEYVDGLEERIRQGAEEKKMLLNRVKQLEQQRNRLIVQMNKLQALVSNTTVSKATPSVSLFIVLLSVLLITLPNLKAPQDAEWKDQQQATARRALLSKASIEDSQRNLDEFLTFNKDDESELQNMLYDDENNTDESVPYSKYFKNFGATFDDVDQRFKNKESIASLFENSDFNDEIREAFGKVKQFLQQTEFGEAPGSKRPLLDNVQIKRKFIEPDIDDDEDAEVVSPKRYRFSNEGDLNVVSATVLVNSPSKKE